MSSNTCINFSSVDLKTTTFPENFCFNFMMSRKCYTLRNTNGVWLMGSLLTNIHIQMRTHKHTHTIKHSHFLFLICQCMHTYAAISIIHSSPLSFDILYDLVPQKLHKCACSIMQHCFFHFVIHIDSFVIPMSFF